MAFIGFVFFGDTIFRTLSVEPPQLYVKIKDSRWMYLIIGFLLSSNIQSSLLSTGAYEVFVNDELQFSKLETGRMPDRDDMVSMFAPFGIVI